MKVNGDSLLERTQGSRADEDELSCVVEAYLADMEAGRPVDPERLVAEHPSIAGPLRACLASLEFVERAAGSLTGSTAAPPTAEPARAAMPTLGDYQIVREIGRGGMGIVYEAEQLSLGRRVALKVLPFAAVLDPRQLQRFKNEAQAAAQLHHTNIVPVFSVGCERGVHYYAMQYIEGRTLAGAIGDLRQLSGLEPDGAAPAGQQTIPPFGDVSPPGSTKTPAFFRSTASLGMQAAEALEHAHAAGIVHRDIKPSNLLLDAKGDLWVTDFGLARFPGDGGLTLTGDVLGTLSYMSPEQALAKHALVDHRSDIYSLGATLYELVTLEPVIGGRDREEILRRIAFDEPRPPRHVNGAVPLELETIIQKAIAKEPERRYATARELADDLRRFLEDKPIHARRPTLLERAAKWSRRHKTVVRAAGVVLVLAVAGLTASTLVVYRAQRATSAALVKAEINFDKARGVVDRMLTWVSEDPLAKTPHMEAVRKRLLEDALKFYQGFLEEKSADPDVRRGTGEAHRRVGQIYKLLGEHSKAEAEFGEAAKIFEALTADRPGVPAYTEELVTTRRQLGSLWRDLGRLKEAEETIEKAVALEESLVISLPGEPRHRFELALAYLDLGSLFHSPARHKEAEEAYRKSLSLLIELEKASPESADYQRSLANSYHNLGMLLKDTGRTGEAEDAYRQALARRQKLSAVSPTPGAFMEEAGSQFSIGVLLLETRRPESARKAFEDAIVLQSKIVRDYPSVPRHKDELASTYNSLANLDATTGHPAEALKSFEEALRLQEKNAEDYPAVPVYRRELGRSHNNIGIVLQDSIGKPEDAKVHYTRAREIFEKLAAELPAVPDYKEGLAQSFNNLGDLLQKTGDLDAALKSFQQSHGIFKALAEQFPKVPDYSCSRAMAAFNLASLQTPRKDAAAARALLDDSIAGLTKSWKEHKEDPRFLQYLVALYGGLGDALSAQGDHSELARRCRELAQIQHAGPDALYAAATLLSRAASIAAKDSEIDEARRASLSRSYADEALKLLEASVEKGFKDLEDLKKNEDLAPVREREEFRRVLQGLEAQSK